MKFKIGRVVTCFLTGCMAFGSALLHADGYGLVLVKDTYNQTVEVIAKEGPATRTGALPLNAVLPLVPGGIYVFQFEEDGDLEEECPFLEVKFEAVNKTLDVELPFTYRVDLESSGSPIRNILSPLGHNKWLDHLAENGIRIYFRSGDRCYPLSKCDSGEGIERKEGIEAIDLENETYEESKDVAGAEGKE